MPTEGLVRPVGFVFGGGGILGACEVGMVNAPASTGIRPDPVVGTSVGAINGVAVAADPTGSSAGRLVSIWEGLSVSDVFANGPFRQIHPTGAGRDVAVPIRYRNTSGISVRVARARVATAAYLTENGLAR